MTEVIAVLIPVMVTVLLGFGMARTGFADPAMMRAVNSFAITIAVPALVFRLMATMPFHELFNVRYLLAWLISSFVLFVLGAYVGRRLEGEVNGAVSVRGQCCVIGNVGFLGIAVLVDFVGPKAATAIAMVLIIDLLLIIPAGIVFFERAKGHDDGWRAFIRAAGGALKHPFSLTIIAGILWSATGLALPDVIGSTLTFIGNAASPAALFGLGLSLHFLPIGTGRRETLALSLIKVILHPALVGMTGYFLGVEPFWLACAVLLAAMPAANNVFVFAQQYNIYAMRAASVIVLSTVISVVTLSFLMWQLTDVVRAG